MLASPHFGVGQANFGGSATVVVDFTGSAVFSSGSSYHCTLTSVGTPVTTPHYGITYTSGSSMTIVNDGGAGSDTVTSISIGS